MSAWRRRIPATLAAVDAVCQELRRGAIAIPEQERFTVELLLREALTNAVTHGSAGEVWCEIEPLASGVVLRVGDSGPGFDWRRLVHNTPPHAAESGRGIQILRSYSSALRFNEQGNQVEVFRIFRQGGENGEL